MKTFVNIIATALLIVSAMSVFGCPADSADSEKTRFRKRLNELQEKVDEQRDEVDDQKDARLADQRAMLIEAKAEKNIMARELAAERARNSQIQIDAAMMRNFSTSPSIIIFCVLAVLFIPTISVIALVYLFKTRAKSVVYIASGNVNDLIKNQGLRLLDNRECASWLKL